MKKSKTSRMKIGKGMMIDPSGNTMIDSNLPQRGKRDSEDTEYKASAKTQMRRAQGKTPAP